MLHASVIPVEPEPALPPIVPPDPPVKEPEPDRLPDEEPLPNPDEHRKPPVINLYRQAATGDGGRIEVSRTV